MIPCRNLIVHYLPDILIIALGEDLSLFEFQKLLNSNFIDFNFCKNPFFKRNNAICWENFQHTGRDIFEIYFFVLDLNLISYKDWQMV